jgi:hypothetical protein
VSAKAIAAPGGTDVKSTVRADNTTPAEIVGPILDFHVEAKNMEAVKRDRGLGFFIFFEAAALVFSHHTRIFSGFSPAPIGKVPR